MQNKTASQDQQTKAEKREQKKRNQRKMKVEGSSVKKLQRLQGAQKTSS